MEAHFCQVKKILSDFLSHTHHMSQKSWGGSCYSECHIIGNCAGVSLQSPVGHNITLRISMTRMTMVIMR